MKDMQAKRAVDLFTAIRKEIENEHEVANDQVENANEVATALTQAVLVAEAISGSLSDVGPLISAAISNIEIPS